MGAVGIRIRKPAASHTLEDKQIWNIHTTNLYSQCVHDITWGVAESQQTSRYPL